MNPASGARVGHAQTHAPATHSHAAHAGGSGQVGGSPVDAEVPEDASPPVSSLVSAAPLARLASPPVVDAAPPGSPALLSGALPPQASVSASAGDQRCSVEATRLGYAKPMRALHCSLVALAVAAAPACASRYKADASAPTYAAQAKISVKMNKTGNRILRVEMLHLAPPQKIDPTHRAYVVWIAVPGEQITRAGALNYNDRRRRGVLVATTPHAKFEVVVTLEGSATPGQPSQKEILRKLVSKI